MGKKAMQSHSDSDIVPVSKPLVYNLIKGPFFSPIEGPFKKPGLQYKQKLFRKGPLAIML